MFLGGIGNNGREATSAQVPGAAPQEAGDLPKAEGSSHRKHVRPASRQLLLFIVSDVIKLARCREQEAKLEATQKKLYLERKKKAIEKELKMDVEDSDKLIEDFKKKLETLEVPEEAMQVINEEMVLAYSCFPLVYTSPSLTVSLRMMNRTSSLRWSGRPRNTTSRGLISTGSPPSPGACTPR
jgi:hypothetical protein